MEVVVGGTKERENRLVDARGSHQPDSLEAIDGRLEFRTKFQNAFFRLNGISVEPEEPNRVFLIGV